MLRRKVDLRKVFLPSDSIAFVVIALGLFIALFLDEMAVRLIGVCITILGGVALFMMVSPRLADMSGNRAPRPSDSPSIESQVKRDPLKTSRVFDSKEYKDTFGIDESEHESVVDEKQIALWDDEAPKSEAIPEKRLEPIRTPVVPIETELGDGVSSVRILGKRSASADAKEPALAINSRVAGKSEQRMQPSLAPVFPAVTGPITEEIKLSDDVIVRPKSQDKQTEKSTEATVQTPRVADVPQNPGAEEMEHEISEENVLQERVSQEVPVRKRKSEIAVSAFMADNDDEMESSEEPRKEFDYLLNRVLMVIRSATNARTAAFFWFNKEKNELVLEASISDATEELIKERKIPLGRDVVSQIALDGRPEILTEISPAAELDLLSYYRYRAGTLSFVGVPVYYRGNVVGVLCADSKIEDAYSDVTVGFFGHFTKLISGLVSSYTTKFDLQQKSRVLDALQTFKTVSQDSPSSVERVLSALTDTVIRLMEVSTIGYVVYDHTRHEWTVRDVQSVIEDYHSLIGSAVDLARTAVGQCITSGRVVTSTSSNQSTRITPKEPNVLGAQFIALPMRSTHSTYGAMFLENNEGSLSQQDLAVAETLADHAGTLIEQIRGLERLQDSALLDYDTGILNLSGFESRVREEFARSTDYQLPLTVCLIKTDPLRPGRGHETEKIQRIILSHVLSRIQEQIREYDVIGRYSDDVIVVGLVAYTSHEAHFWTEGLRRDIASTPLDVDGKRITTTISAGIAQANPRDSWDTLLQNAASALDISAQLQNKVTVFS